MRAAIDSCHIVGAMFSLNGASCFDEADVVVCAEAGLLRVRTYLQTEVEGEAYTEQQWADFVADDQGTNLPLDGLRLGVGAVLWVLRPSFESRDAAVRELETSGALIYPVTRAPPQPHSGLATLLCVVSRPAARPLLAEWGQQAYLDAMTHARAGCWPAALACAEQAFVLEPALDEARLALLTLAFSRNGRRTRADGYLAMAERSRGEAFRSRVQSHVEALEREIDGSEPCAPVTPRRAGGGREAEPDHGPREPRKAAWRDAAREHNRAGLEDLWTAA